MLCGQILPLALLLALAGPLWSHPIADSAEMPYSGPVSVEDQGMGSLGEFSLSERGFPQQDSSGLRYGLLASELNREGTRGAGPLARGLKREGNQSLLSPFSHLLGIRRQFRKRGGNTECFWKYCV